MQPATSDRRTQSRGAALGVPDRRDIVARIEGSYREMPGLSLRLEQAAKLFGLPLVTCSVVFADLARSGRLRRTLDGRYVLAER